MNYESGRGVEQDNAQAFKWYRKSAEQGDPQGQVALATSYQKGQGVAKDYAEALKWYRKAADHGSAVGQASLGGMYVMGQGVEKDFVEAYTYLSLAVTSGFAEVGQLRDAVGRKLSEAQLSDAQKRIDRLKAEVLARRFGNETNRSPAQR